MTILQSLARLHGRLESNGRAPSYGFSRENISFVVALSRRGEPVDVQDVRDMTGKTPSGVAPLWWTPEHCAEEVSTC